MVRRKRSRGDSQPLADNTTTGTYASGGALYVLDGVATIASSTLSENGTVGVRSGGGAMAVISGEATIRNSTISGNSTGGAMSPGGGIRSLLSPTRLINSTVSGNSAGSLSSGGGIYADRGLVTVQHSTITENTAAGVGGGIALPTLSTLLLTIRHSIVAANTDGGGAPDLLGTGGLIPSEAIRYSLIGDNRGTALDESQAQDSDTGNIVGDLDGDGVIDPGLGPLSDNGGPTQTHPLLAGSPAIDAGDSNFDPDAFSPPLNDDQRGDGFQRVVADRIDLGAFESTLGILIDFGDAPTSYPVTLGDDGARHILSGLFFGADVDAEIDGQPSSAADADGEDEDGMIMIADAVAVAGVETVASWLVEASGSGKLDAWIDFNGDGDWNDAGEKVHSSIELMAGSNLLGFTVPAGASPGVTFARLRISSVGGLDPTGLAPDGEVEDHPLLILDGSSAPTRW